MYRKKLLVFVVPIVFVGCCHITDNKDIDCIARNQFQTQLKQMYSKNIVDFFPSEWTQTEERQVWGAYYYPSDDDSIYSKFRCCAYFSDSVKIELIDSIVSKGYSETSYSDTALKINIPYMNHIESYNRLPTDTLQVPIADLRYAFFNLGEREDSITFDGRTHLLEATVLPPDVSIYLYEFSNGNYWKDKRAENEERPGLSNHWKHGYVKGYALSRSRLRIVWWAMAW